MKAAEPSRVRSRREGHVSAHVGEDEMDFTAWCGRCDHWTAMDVATKKEAGRKALRAGWRWTDGDGLICPGCCHAADAGHEVMDGACVDPKCGWQAGPRRRTAP